MAFPKGYGHLTWLSYALPVALACFIYLLRTHLAYITGTLDVPIYFIAVVVVDIGHVWSTMFRTYLDVDEVARHPLRYALVPISMSLIGSLLYYIGPSFFWTFVAYFAIYHFMKQNYGLLMLIKAHAGDRGSLNSKVDKWAIYSACVFPLLVWHTYGEMDWFNHGERFVVSFPPEWRYLFNALGILALCGYTLVQVYQFTRSRLFFDKILFLLFVLFQFSAGLLFHDPLVALSIMNLFHGIPAAILVWYVTVQKGRTKPCPSILDRIAMALTSGSFGLLKYALVLVFFATVEEFFWDTCIYQTSHTKDTGFQEIFDSVAEGIDSLFLRAGMTKAMVAGILVTPQLTHYYLDQFIWKMDGSNPDLKGLLFGKKIL